MTRIRSLHHAFSVALVTSLTLCAACASRPQAKPAAEKPTNTPAAAPPPSAPSAPEAAPEQAQPTPPPSAAKPKTKPPANAKPRIIHPLGDAQDCMEMYGFCTPPPERLCTSSAFVLSCGETGQLPTPSHEWLRCVCP